MHPPLTASLSDVGRRRRANQDHCAEFPGPDGDVLLVCCDGMGGHQGGEVASQLAVATIGEAFARVAGAPATRLEHAFKEANRRVREKAASDPRLEGMGTTAVALYFDGAAAAWTASVGDSRAYRVRAGRAEQLTRDHSIVAELIRLGRLDPADAANQPHNQLARAIGAEDDVEVDTAQFDAKEGDRWLLCSDGLWNLVGDAEIAQVVGREVPAEAARLLVEQANARGGTDNVTVQVLSLDGGVPKVPAPAPAQDAVAPTRAEVAEEATADQIWEEHEAERRARSQRRALTALGIVALLSTLALAAALWFGSQTRDPAAPPEKTRPEVPTSAPHARP